jgi:glycosyltransferase involved in cell wall biosynthesis
LVITVHDLIHERMPHLFPRHDRTRERKEKAIQAADHIICVSEYTRGELTKIYGVAPERTSVVHHGCNPPPAMVDTAPRSDRPYILYVGARDGYKNFEAILQALSGSKLSRSLDVVAFGGPPWTMRDASLVRRNGLLEGRVRYRSGQDEDLAGLYRRAEALIVPSFVEGFGLPILEAMSLGCPVICSGTTSLPEVAGDAAQYFDPGDPSSIAAAIESVVGNARRREDLVRRGSARVLDFSWERTAAKTRDVYMKTAGLPAG